MRFLATMCVCVGLCASLSAARAESRIFIVANEADGYGIDMCLARGEACGKAAARAYCETQHFAAATTFRKVEADEVTGSVPEQAACTGGICGAMVAITCAR